MVQRLSKFLGGIDADMSSVWDWTGTSLDITGNFSSTGIDDNATSIALTIDDAERLLVGYTSVVAVNGVGSAIEVLGTDSGSGSLLTGMWSADASPAALYFYKSRNTTPGLNTIINTGDNIGDLFFLADDGVDENTQSALIRVTAEGTIDVGRVPSRMEFYTGTDVTSTVATLALTLDSAQNATFAGTLIAGAGSGFGLAWTQGTLQVQTADSGATVNSGADDLVIEGNTDAGSSILTPDGNTSHFYMGSPSDNKGLYIDWNYNAGTAIVGTSKVGGTLALYADNQIVNLTLSGASGSELATFAGTGAFNSASAGTVLTITSTDAGASLGPNLILHRDSASPLANDLIPKITFMGEDSISSAIEYASIITRIVDPTTGSADGQLDINITNSGAAASIIRLNSIGATINEAGGDLDFRVESVTNTHMFFVDAGNNRAGFGITPTDGTLHIHTASAGTWAAITSADDLVIENSTSGGLVIGVPDANIANIMFSSPSTTASAGALISYQYSASAFNIKSNKVGGSLILSGDASVINLTLSGGVGSELAVFEGTVTKPAQPAFLAFNSAVDNNVTGNGTNATVDFDTEVFDQDSDFTADTFTAPVAGKYQFSFSVRLQGITAAATAATVSLVTSNRTYAATRIPADDLNSTQNFTLSILADMDVSDTAFVRVNVTGEASDVVDISGDATELRTCFSGYLVA